MLFFCAVFAVSSQAQQSQKLPADLMQYYIGKWKGEGTFSNGRPIASTVTFRMSLDSAWLQNEHVDVPPNIYKALSLWGVEKDGTLIAFTFDNFHGHRQFTANYSQDKLMLMTTGTFQGAKLYQRFVYEKLSLDAFKMAYETSLDSVKWRMGDTLIYHRMM